MSPLLEIESFSMDIVNESGSNQILDEVTLSVSAGECVALVGESGSGKSMTARAVLGMSPAGARLSGKVLVDGTNMIGLSRARTIAVRRNTVSMIYQDPRSGINPMQRIGSFLVEGVVNSGRLDRAAARSRAISLMRAVRLRDPDRLLERYAFELSGGMLQRIMIVAALMTEPRLLLCDEPTTALDVTNQAEVVATLRDLQREQGLGMVFITHDLDLAAAIADRVCVMYRGRLVETGQTDEVLDNPRHAYTRALLAARPHLDGDPRVRLTPVTEAMATINLEDAE